MRYSLTDAEYSELNEVLAKTPFANKPERQCFFLQAQLDYVLWYGSPEYLNGEWRYSFNEQGYTTAKDAVAANTVIALKEKLAELVWSAYSQAKAEAPAKSDGRVSAAVMGHHVQKALGSEFTYLTSQELDKVTEHILRIADSEGDLNPRLFESMTEYFWELCE